MSTNNQPQSGLTPLDSISIENAIAWTKNWQKLFPTHSKAFLIPIIDLLNLLQELKVIRKNDDGTFENLSSAHPHNKAIRAYMAIGDTDGDGDLEERLVMVGAIENDEGIYVDQVPKRRDNATVTLSGSGAFDFTIPCPNDCDPKSSLNQQ